MLSARSLRLKLARSGFSRHGHAPRKQRRISQRPVRTGGVAAGRSGVVSPLLSTYTALGRAERQLEVSEGRGGEAAAEASRAIRRAAGLIVLAEGLALAASAPARSDADDEGAQ